MEVNIFIGNVFNLFERDFSEIKTFNSFEELMLHLLTR